MVICYGSNRKLIHLVTFGWMPDIVNCTLLGARYLCVPINIFSFVLGHKLFENSWIPGLPWWSSGEESTLQCRGRWFDPCWGTEIPYAVGQLSPRATTTELVCPN